MIAVSNVYLAVGFVCAFVTGAVISADVEPRQTYDGPEEYVEFDVSAAIERLNPTEPDLADQTYDRILTFEERSRGCWEVHEFGGVDRPPRPVEDGETYELTIIDQEQCYFAYQEDPPQTKLFTNKSAFEQYRDEVVASKS